MSRTTQTTLRPPQGGIHYPEGDGKPMAETDLHRDLMTYFISVLRGHLRDRAYVTGNILLYYEEGNPARAVSPDCMVVFDSPGHRRRTYKLWQERTPDLVIEVTSRKSRREDQKDKTELYRRLGVRELWLIDPAQEYLDEPIIGYQLQEGNWLRVPFAQGRAFSEALSLEFRETDHGVRLYDPDQHCWLLPMDESLEQQRQRAEREQARAEREQARADRMAAEAAALRAELAKLRDELKQP